MERSAAGVGGWSQKRNFLRSGGSRGVGVRSEIFSAHVETIEVGAGNPHPIVFFKMERFLARQGGIGPAAIIFLDADVLTRRCHRADRHGDHHH